MTTVETIYRRAVRVGTSYYGNPTYDLVTDAGTFRTMSNAACGYEATNPRDGQPITLHLTRAGRVRYFDYDREAQR